MINNVKEIIVINDKKEKILRVVAELFRKFGFRATSINDIIRETSTSRGALYYYFPSKQAMLFDVVSRGMNHLLPAVRQINSSDLGPREKLRKVTKSHIVSLLENLDFVGIGLRETDLLEEPHRTNFYKMRKEYESIVKEILRKGIELGVFPSLNIKLTTFAIFDICNGPARWYKPHGPLSPEQIAEEYSNFICIKCQGGQF